MMSFELAGLYAVDLSIEVGNVPVPFTLALVLIGFLGMGVGRAQRS